MTSATDEVTQLLIRWSNGNPAALDELIPLVTAELRRLARTYMARENPGHTLQTSALINEAYIRLIDQNSVQWQNRAHFFAVAAQVMRHILIDHARSHCYAKRGGGARKVPLDEAAAMTDRRAEELVALDEAVNALATLDSRKSRIIDWTPTGTGLSYPWNGPIEGQPGRQIFNIWEQLLTGGKPRQLTKFAEPIFVHAWSRDGKTLAVLTAKYTSDVVLISDVK